MIKNENKDISNEKVQIKELRMKIEKEFHKSKITYENFELLDHIGSGKDTFVFKSIIKKTKKIIAMKIISIKENKKNANEINIHTKLKNKNII